MEIREIWEIIWRRKWIIIQAFIVIVGISIVGTFLMTPIYEKSAKIFVETSSSTTSSLLSGIGLKNLSSMLGSSTDTELESYIQLITLDPVLEKIIEKLKLKRQDGTLLTPGELRQGEGFLSKLSSTPHVNVEEIEDTDLIRITATSARPEEAAMIANAVAEEFIESNLKRRREEYGNAKRFIKEQSEGARKEFLDALEEIKQYQIGQRTINLEQETKVGIQKMAELMKEKEDNIIDISEIRAKIQMLKAQLGEKGERPSSSFQENLRIKELKKTISDLEVDLAGLLAEKGEKHVAVRALRNQIEKAKLELKAETKLFREAPPKLEELERELAALEVHLSGVNADIEKYSKLLNTLPDKSLLESQIKLRLKISRELYSSLLKYLYQIGVAEAMTLSDIRLVEAAKVRGGSAAPKYPNKLLNVIVGCILGLLFGLGIAFLTDYLDDTIKTRDDVKSYGYQFLGAIPKMKQRQGLLISDRDPKDYLSEAYRTIRNSIKFASIDRPVRSIMVTSCLAAEGKTTSVANLGISFSREGKKVLLIDTDFRKPSLHTVLGEKENVGGLTTVVAEEIALKEAILETNIPGLYLLNTGPLPSDPGGIIESMKLRDVIDNLKEMFDLLILDSPPILVATDSMILSKDVHGTVMVMESEKVTHRALSQAKEMIVNADVQLIGVILNKFKVQKGSYYYYPYKAAYDYYGVSKKAT